MGRHLRDLRMFLAGWVISSAIWNWHFAGSSANVVGALHWMTTISLVALMAVTFIDASSAKKS